MPTAAYKDLCIDASDPRAIAGFWGQLLGWQAHLHGDGDADLRDGEEVMVWVNGVPEPVSAKNRLHIDVNARSLDDVVALGAEVVDDSQKWTVMRDPDGQVFCVFVRDTPVTRPFYELVWDVTGKPAAALRLAEWWAALLGAKVVDDGAFSHLEDVPGVPFDYLVFQPVPEDKTTKNRIHIDVTADDVAPLVATGATLLRAKGGDIRWHVLADPQGNEFCAFTPG